MRLTLLPEGDMFRVFNDGVRRGLIDKELANTLERNRSNPHSPTIGTYAEIRDSYFTGPLFSVGGSSKVTASHFQAGRWLQTCDHGDRLQIYNSKVDRVETEGWATITNSEVRDAELENTSVHMSIVSNVVVVGATIDEMHILRQEELLTIGTRWGILTAAPNRKRTHLRFAVGCQRFETLRGMEHVASGHYATAEELERLQTLKPLIELMERRLQEGGK